MPSRALAPRHPERLAERDRPFAERTRARQRNAQSTKRTRSPRAKPIALRPDRTLRLLFSPQSHRFAYPTNPPRTPLITTVAERSWTTRFTNQPRPGPPCMSPPPLRRALPNRTNPTRSATDERARERSRQTNPSLSRKPVAEEPANDVRAPKPKPREGPDRPRGSRLTDSPDRMGRIEPMPDPWLTWGQTAAAAAPARCRAPNRAAELHAPARPSNEN